MSKFRSIRSKLFLLSSSLIIIMISLLFLSFTTISILNDKDIVGELQSTLLLSYQSYSHFKSDKSLDKVYLFEEAIKTMNEKLNDLGGKKNKVMFKYIDDYEQKFQEFISFVKIRGLNENIGLEGSFRDHAHDLEKRFKDKKDDQILSQLLELRRREKDFLLRGNQIYVEMVNNYIFSLESIIKNKDYSPREQKELIQLLKNYISSFNRMVEVIKKIEVADENFNNYEDKLQKSFTKLYSKMNDRAALFKQLIIIISIIGIILAFGIAINLSNTISKPIKKLTGIIKGIRTDDLSERVNVKSDDEIGELASSFNNMLIMLEKAYDEIEESKDNLEEKVIKRTEELQNEIDERKSYEIKLKETFNRLSRVKTELAEALSKEKELNELKSRFVSMISHEYRTPLTVLQTSTYLLTKFYESSNEDSFLDRINKMNKTIDSMRILLEDTLTIDKIEQGHIEVNNEDFELNEFIDSAISELSDVKKNGQKFNVQSNASSLVINSDPKLLRHCLSNLINNAIKYSPEFAEINIEISKFNKGVQFIISDKGIGIPDEDQRFLFKPFHRSKNTTGIQGTGLGLSITKQFVESLGGEISFSSKENVGTTFKVTLFNN